METHGLLDLAYAAVDNTGGAASLFLRHGMFPVVSAAIAEFSQARHDSPESSALAVVVATQNETTSRFCVVTRPSERHEESRSDTSADSSQRELKVLAHVSSGLGHVSAVYLSDDVNGEVLFWSATELGIHAYDLT